MCGFGFFLYEILNRFEKVTTSKNEVDLTNYYIEIKNKLAVSLNTNCWDGRWYKRAFTDDSKVLRKSDK